MENPKCKLFTIKAARAGLDPDLDDQFNQWVGEQGEKISVISIHPNSSPARESLYVLYNEHKDV